MATIIWYISFGRADVRDVRDWTLIMHGYSIIWYLASGLGMMMMSLLGYHVWLASSTISWADVEFCKLTFLAIVQ